MIGQFCGAAYSTARYSPLNLKSDQLVSFPARLINFRDILILEVTDPPCCLLPLIGGEKSEYGPLALNFTVKCYLKSLLEDGQGIVA